MLSDDYKINFLSTNSRFYSMKIEMTYQDKIKINSIQNLWYIDCFSSVTISSLSDFLIDTSNLFNSGYFKYRIPKNLTHLAFASGFNEDISGYIPDNVTTLILGDDFNRDINGCIPKNVKYLTFGVSFNQNIRGCIPCSVTELNFGECFNQNIRKCLPNNITKLVFGSDFNQNIEDSIPESVKYLKFGSDFNQNIRNCIPDSVKYLCFGDSFNKSIHNCIPFGVETIRFGRKFYQYIGSIPNSVKYLELCNFEENIQQNLPQSITQLVITSEENNDIDVSHLVNLRSLYIRYHRYEGKIMVPPGCEINICRKTFLDW